MEAPWLWLVPLLPLLGAAGNGLLHARTLWRRARAPEGTTVPGPERASGLLGTLVVAASFAVAVAAFLVLRGLPPEQRVLTAHLAPWIQAGALDVSWSLLVDPLSATMMLVVTGVSALIHLYSTGYMHGDPGFARYFAYLNLFVAMMLVLVLSDTLLGLFLGWEGVGLCSYLLIGFWYEDGLKADAARKAFIVNRIGDFGFLVGMFLLYWGGAGTLGFAGVNEAAMDGTIPAGLLTLAAVGLFVGCTGKSAQIPLFVWLPDAMAGPTPVSALIHAATMVTAGVYLVARMADTFAAAGILPVIAVVGTLTALLAATIGLAQRDIKKVLAYSTVSQLGYMFLGLGVGAFSAAVFHLVTHAFFKALLFLGAGSVIHAMGGRQDMLGMGGLRRRIPITWTTMLVGALALAGIPGFAGFFSKDEILFRTATGPTAPWLLWAVGAGGALLTALYTGRLLALTFLGKPRFDADEVHVHESPPSMTVPLRVLAVLSVLGGLLGIPLLLHPLETWLAPVVEEAAVATRGEAHPDHLLEIGLLVVGSAIGLAGLIWGVRRFQRDVAGQQAALDAPRGLQRVLAGAWFVDELYAAVVLAPLKALRVLCAAFDTFVIDFVVNALASLSRRLGQVVRRVQSGGVGDYALWFGLGAAVIVLTLYLGARG